LVRTGDVEGEIDEKLKIEVLLPRNHTLEGILELYHLDYNIALVRLKHDLIHGMCPQDILNVREPSKSVGLKKRKSDIGRAVANNAFGT
jgi:hypothetical protein